MNSEAAALLQQRTRLVLGDEGVSRLAAARVAVFGLGGVGSYAAEALARSGVGALVLVDGDVIEASNINRQLYALISTIGRAKVDVAKERILDINSECKVQAVKAFIGKESMADVERYVKGASYVIDAVDTVAAKTAIIMASRKEGVSAVSCMGTGNKVDPTLLQVADISETAVCPLARSVRHELRKQGITSGVKVVYSTEKPQQLPFGQTVGSVSFVPPVAGMLMASCAVRCILGIA